MATYFAIRDGQIKLTIPNATIKSDGTVWQGNMPVTDGQSEGAKALGREKLVALLRAKKYADIPADVFGRVGVSASGMEIISQADYIARARAAMTPAEKERARINGLYAKAERRLNASDDCNTMDYYRIKGEADKALAAWREKYGAEAKEERRAAIRAKADKKRELASGALTYDADGWISPEEQQKRHDDCIAQAEALEAEADNL